MHVYVRHLLEARRPIVLIDQEALDIAVCSLQRRPGQHPETTRNRESNKPTDTPDPRRD